MTADHGLYGDASAWTLGERVTLRYDPADPQRAAPTTLMSNHFAPLIGGILTVVFLTLGWRCSRIRN